MGVNAYEYGEEAPEYMIEGTDNLFNGHESKSLGYQTSTLIGDKIYVVGGSEQSAGDSSICVNIFDELKGERYAPTVLGTKPVSCKGHSAVLLNEDRILILKRECSTDDCIWFLEVDTPFVKEQKRLLGTEVVAWSKGIVGEAPKPVVISGPSAVGKGTLIKKLMIEFPSTFGFSVSHTTRAPREKEVNGVDYHFTERSVMEKDIREGKFLEFASVHENLYGTSIEAVEAVTDTGKRCILDIDVQGARSVRASSLEALFIFICPPSLDELEKRLRARGTETEEQIQKRLRNAIAELDQGRSSGLFDHILVNDDLESCYQNLKKLLALEETPDASSPGFAGKKNFKIPTYDSVPKKDQKILIHCGSNMLVIDVSSLKGGAPGRTRGLNISEISSLTDCVNGIEQL